MAAGLCVITSSATRALHLGTTVVVQDIVWMTVVAHLALCVGRVRHVMSMMVIGDARLAMP